MAKTSFDYCLGSADSNLKKALTAALSDAGFHASGEARNVPEFLRLLRLKQPWLAVIDTRIPPGNIKQLASIVEEDNLSASLFVDTGNKGLSGYMQLKWPVESAVLAAVAETLCHEYARKRKLHSRIEGLENKLKERREIEKAKGIIMKKMKLDEERAYRYLQKKSMEHRISLGEAACRIIDGSS